VGVAIADSVLDPHNTDNGLKASEIAHAFQSWISNSIEKMGCHVIALDGKTARRHLLLKIKICITCSECMELPASASLRANDC